MNPDSQPAPAPEIRALSDLGDFDQCVELQQVIWNYNPTELVPRRMFLVAARIGGQVLGAFRGATMIGFALAFPGFRNGHSYLHSQMVGVLAEHRNSGTGRLLKLAQRDDALRRGIELMEWTFDPLEIKNAHLNIDRLGVISRRYQRDFYGPSSSPLQGGLPTDRLYAEWWLRSARVARALAGTAQPAEVIERVDVPAEVYAWKARPAQRTLAHDVQAGNAQALEGAFLRGLSVVGYERTSAGDGSFLLGKWDEDFNY